METRRQKVLVVDDTPDNIHVLMETLKDDYAVVAAINGERALKLAAADPGPDIILLDVMMPGMSGYEVCQRLKADPATSSIPVVFITAMGESGDEAKGLELGAVDYIIKPFIPALVKARVHNQLELKLHRDHLEELVRERTRELALTREVTIETLADLAETRDPETGGHIKRTQGFVRALARAIKDLVPYAGLLDDAYIELLYLSAPLHDIGKVGVPDAILNKPGKLTDEEFARMKEHCVIGYKALLGAQKRLGESSFLRLAGEVALTHHEKWDGSGYPKGLRGEEIPISGRLMAIADVYDALTCRRVYKPPFPHEQAMGIITEGRGRHFDPALVDALLSIEGEFRRIALQYADGGQEPEADSTPSSRQ
jgi:putative two-component system response regulator